MLCYFIAGLDIVEDLIDCLVLLGKLLFDQIGDGKLRAGLVSLPGLV
jgi:hypothetical protein